MSSAALWDLELARVKRRLAQQRERKAEHEESLLGRIRAHLAFKDQQQELGEVDEWVAAEGDDHDMGLDFLQGVDEEDMRTLLNEEVSRMQPVENGEVAEAAKQQQDQVQLEHAPIPMPESLISPTKASTATVSSAEISVVDMDTGGDLHLESETQAQVAMSVSLGGDADVTELLNELQLDLGNTSVLSSNSSNTTVNTTSTSASAPVMANDNNRPAWQARSGQQPANHASAPKAKPVIVSNPLLAQQQETQRAEHDAVGAEMVSWVSGYRDPEVVRRKENTPQRKRRATTRYGADTYQEQLSVRRAAKYYAQESDYSSNSDSPDSAGSDFAPMEEEPEDITRLDDEPLSEIELLSDDYLNSDEGSKRQPRRRRRLRKGVDANVSPQVNKARQPRQTRRSRRKQLEPTKRVDSSVSRRPGSHAPQVADTEKASEGQVQTLTGKPAGKKQEQTIDLRSSDDEDTVIMGRSKDAHIVDLESTSNTDDSSVTIKKNTGQVKQMTLQNDLKDSLILRLKTPKAVDIREISSQTPLKASSAVATVGDDELSDTGTLNNDVMDDDGGADEEVPTTPPLKSIVGDTENLAIHIPEESADMEDEYMSDTGTVVDYEDLSEAGTEDFEEVVPAQESTLEEQDNNSTSTHAAKGSLNSANLPSSPLSIEEKLAKAGFTTSMPAATEMEAPKKSGTDVDIVVQTSDLQTMKQPHVDTAEKSKQPPVDASGDVSDAETVDLAQVDEDDLGLDYSDDEDEDVQVVAQPTQKNDENGVEQFDFDGSAPNSFAMVKTKTLILTRPTGTPAPKPIPVVPTNATESEKPTGKAIKVIITKKKALVLPLKQTIGSNGLRKRAGNAPVETVPATKGKFTYNRRAIKVLGSESGKNHEKVVETISANVTSRSTSADSGKTTKRYLGYGKQKADIEDDSLDDEPLARSTAPKSKYGGGGFDPPTQIPRDPFERRTSEATESKAPKPSFQFTREPQLSVYQALHLPEREEGVTSLLGDDHKRPTKFIKAQEDKKKRGIAFISSIPVDLESAPIPKKPKAKAANGSASRYGGFAGQESATSRESNNNGRRDSGDCDHFQGGSSRSWNDSNNNGHSSKRSNSRRERSPSPGNRRNGYKNKKDYASRPHKQHKNNRSYEVHDKYGPSSRSPLRDRSRDFRDKDSSFKDRRQSYDDRKRSRSRSNSRSRSARNDREDNRGRKSFSTRETERMRDHSRSPQTRRHDDFSSQPRQEDRPQASYEKPSEKPSRLNYDDNPRELKKLKHQDCPNEDENTIRAAPISLASMDQDEFTYIIDSDIDDDEILLVEDESAPVVDIRFDLSSVSINERECDKCVYVTGINFSMDEGVLNEVFAPFGVQVRRQRSTCSVVIAHE